MMKSHMIRPRVQFDLLITAVCFRLLSRGREKDFFSATKCFVACEGTKQLHGTVRSGAEGGRAWRIQVDVGGSLGALSASLQESDGGDRPLSMMAPDRDSQAVQFVEPNIVYSPGLSIGEDDGLAE